jgi:hypothetical protein
LVGLIIFLSVIFLIKWKFFGYIGDKVHGAVEGGKEIVGQHGPVLINKIKDALQ